MDFKLYRYSPIQTKEDFVEAIQYVSETSTKLCKKVSALEYPIVDLTVFAHYQQEFDFLNKILLEMGELKAEINGPFVKLHVPIKLKQNSLQLLRVRKPDPYRMQVGCDDFEIPNYQKFKSNYLGKNTNLRLIERPEYEMIEFYDPDYDVLAYVTSIPLV